MQAVLWLKFAPRVVYPRVWVTLEVVPASWGLKRGEDVADSHLHVRRISE